MLKIFILLLILFPKLGLAQTTKQLQPFLLNQINELDSKGRENRQTIRYIDDEIAKQKEKIKELKELKNILPEKITKYQTGISRLQTEFFMRKNNRKHRSPKREKEIKLELKKDRDILTNLEKRFYKIDTEIITTEILLSNNQLFRDRLINEYKSIRSDKSHYLKQLKQIEK